MSRNSLILEILDRELRAYWFSFPLIALPNKIPKLVNCDLIPIPEGVIEQGILRQETIFSEVIINYLADKRLSKGTSVSIIIPVEQAVIRHFSLPWIPKNKRKSAVRFLVEEEIPVPNTDLSYDYIVLEENHSDNVLHILVGALRESIVRKYSKVLIEAGLRIEKVGFAICGYAQAIGLECNKDKLLLQVGENSLQMILFRGQIPELIRILPLNISLEHPEREWEREIQRVLLYYRNQHSDLKVQEVLVNGNSVAEEVGQGLVAAGIAPIAQRVKIREISGWREKIHLVDDYGLGGLSYALQIFANLPGFNLWQEDKTGIPKIALLSPILSAVILIAGLIYWLPLHNMEGQLQNEVKLLKQKDASAETALEINKKLETAWIKAKDPALNAGDILTRIQNRPGLGLDIKKLEYKQGNIYLEGVAQRAQLVETMLQDLHVLGWGQVNLTSYKQDDSKIEFNLTAANYDSKV